MGARGERNTALHLPSVNSVICEMPDHLVGSNRRVAMSFLRYSARATSAATISRPWLATSWRFRLMTVAWP